MACTGSSSWSVSETRQAREHAERVAAGQADPDARIGDGKPALFVAVEAEDCDSADKLLEHGADTSATWDGWTPLQASIWNGHGTCAEVLLRSGADANLRVRGAPPLFLAARLGDAKSIRALTTRGARVDRAYSRKFAIQVAAEVGDADSVAALLAAGADPNTRGRNGANPMQIAAAAGHEEAAAVLLDAGARLTEIPSDPWTTALTFQWASRYRRQQGDAARAEQLLDIACEYFPLAARELAAAGEDEERVAVAEAGVHECHERGGERGTPLPPWSPALEPQPL